MKTKTQLAAGILPFSLLRWMYIVISANDRQTDTKTGFKVITKEAQL